MRKKTKLKIGIVVPHIFIQHDILPKVIFSPGTLALSLAEGLSNEGLEVTLLTPGRADTYVPNITADMSYFDEELRIRNDTYIDLLKKHPFTFITLARQVQSEITALAIQMANEDTFDLLHFYTNEEDIALPFSQFCKKPVVFTHHDPFNFSVKYKSVFPKYRELNWVSLSLSQRLGMPKDTNWQADIYHGINENRFSLNPDPQGGYVAFMGRIIEPKGVHIAIDAVKQFNHKNNASLKLRIAGKHYAGHGKDSYWKEKIQSEIGDTVEYVGHISDDKSKQLFLGNAKALLVPSVFEEPFGMVSIESLACGTPVIGLSHGATKEIIEDGNTGYIVSSNADSAAGIAEALGKIDSIDRKICRDAFEKRFTARKMVQEHIKVYDRLITESQGRL